MYKNRQNTIIIIMTFGSNMVYVLLEYKFYYAVS